MPGCRREDQCKVTSEPHDGAKRPQVQRGGWLLQFAHGGVLYLDEHGRSTHGAPVRPFCFVSTKEKDHKVEGLHFLRVGMKYYRAFLQLWTKWLQDDDDGRFHRRTIGYESPLETDIFPFL